MAAGLQLGLYTLGDYVTDPITKQPITQAERVKNIIEMALLAEQAGFDIFQLGESHQEHFVSQAHLILLSAIAQATSDIRLASSATIISTSDPVRVYEDSATIDLISNGRMELVCGRSARVGVYELFGYNLAEYDSLFDEKFDLLKLINQRELVTWEGEHRAPLQNQQILPRAIQSNGLPIWRAIGGSIQSGVDAGLKGDPIYVVDFNADMNVYKGVIDAYRTTATQEGHRAQLPVAVTGYLFTRPETQKAIAQYYPYVNEGSMLVNNMPFEKGRFEKATSLDSLINVGSPELIVEKILYQYEKLGMTRYVGQIDFGGMPFDEVKRTIDLLGDKVLPEIRKYSPK